MQGCGYIMLLVAYHFSVFEYHAETHMHPYEPRQDKTCLRKFLTRPDTNCPAQPQKLARVLTFRL